ncbi:MAG: isoaspartyl peptidase/L-asparaginase [Planctomycetota bacterium]|jgi:isoaspartyl peptidase/L-asparaginase-like protein (Ntn-hydrolase superfamily)
MPTPRLLATWSFAARHTTAPLAELLAGADPLDAAMAVAAAVEADPEVDSVGRGGLPDTDGLVSLDALVMRSPAALGAVAGVRDRLPAVRAARAVMDGTPHVLLAGPGAERLADAAGVVERAELLTDAIRERWERRRARAEVDPPRRPIDRGEGRLFADGGEGAGDAGHDTVCVLARGVDGRLAGACSTSGTPWKMPGRIGDSPIPGHGLYVHPRYGAAAATGTGELAMGGCTSFVCVEAMRAGASPADAARRALERIIEDHRLEPHHQLAVIAMAPDGEIGAASLRPDFVAVVGDAGGVRCEPPAFVLLPGEPGEPGESEGSEGS